MSKYDVYREQLWLLEYLENYGHATKQEICEAWLEASVNPDHEPLHQKQALRIISDIDYLFGVHITPDDVWKANFVYRIENPEVLRSNTMLTWYKKCMQFRSNLLSISCLHDRILLEDFPSENERLSPISWAMIHSNKIAVKYKTYDKRETVRHILEPYCIKTYDRRFYVFANTEFGKPCTFSFDRIVDMEILKKEKFNLPYDFNATEYFKNFFGVFTGTKLTKPVKVVVRAYKDAAGYLRDLPLHDSQIEITDKNRVGDYSDFEYLIYPTRDFLSAIIKQLDRLEILSPEWFRKQAIDAIFKLCGRYGVKAEA